MGLDHKVGNRRNFLLTNHRLNKDALLHILDDVMQSVNNANVALLGGGDTLADPGVGDMKVTAAGTDGTWNYSVDTSGSGCVVTFTDVRYLIYAARDSSGYACSKVVQFDPSNPAQTSSSLVLTGFIGQDCYLWFKRNEADADVDSEARWSVGTGEVFTATATMKREWIEFQATTIGPHPTFNEENGYFRFAVIDSWSGSIPAIRFIHFADRKGLEFYDNNPNSKNLNLSMNGGVYSNGVKGAKGLTDLVKDLVNQMYMLQDSDWNITLPRGYVDSVGQTGWYHRPEFGLKQIARRIRGAGSLAQGVVSYDAVTHTYTMEYVRAADDSVTIQVNGSTAMSWSTSSSASGVGYKCTLGVMNVPAGWSVTGIQVQHHWPAHTFLSSFDIRQIMAQPSVAFPFIADGTTDFTIDVVPYSTVAGGDEGTVYAASSSFTFELIGYWE